MRKLLVLSLALTLASCKNQVSDNSNGTQLVTPITDCSASDSTAPVFNSSVTVSEDGSSRTSPTISWTKAQDSCELSHYELAIGTSLGASDVLAFTSIGDVTSYKQENLSLNYSQDYFYSVRAVDKAGNRSSVVNSSSWKIFTPRTLTNLVLWLDAADKDSIEDAAGKSPGESGFTNEVQKWADLSGSSAIHNFTSSGSSRPNWDVTENAIRFNGSNHFMATADHADINTSVVSQRTMAFVVKTDSDIQSRQVIYEEGGTVRGINVYIDAGKLRCGFWNDRNDGDDTQGYIEVETNIEQNKAYTIIYNFDYSHFNGRDGADGTVECFVNGSSVGQVDTTSRLHAHSGDIGLGAMNDGSYFHDGAASSDDHFFKGVIYEFLMYNSAHNSNGLEKLNKVLENKWL